MACGLPRDTENNLDDWEILLEFLSAVQCQHFPIALKDFSIVYYVTIVPYNSKSISRYYVCLSTLVLAYQTAPGFFIRFIRHNVYGFFVVLSFPMSNSMT